MQSKWVAEQLIRQAQQRGIPGSIYRPGIIVGHSQTGATNTQDLASRVLRGCYQLGVYPEQTISFNVVPVDYVGRAIVHLAQQPATLGQVFHLTNPQPTQIADIIKWSGSLGAELQEVSYPEWRTFLMQQAKQRLDNDLLPLLPLFSSDRPEQVKRQVDCQHALHYLADSDIVCPAIDRDLIELYAAYLTNLDFFEVSQ
jgi:thioester reductase-like protein